MAQKTDVARSRFNSMVRYFFSPWFYFKTHKPVPNRKVLILCEDGELYVGYMCGEKWCDKPHYNTECMCPTTLENAVMWRNLPKIPNTPNDQRGV